MKCPKCGFVSFDYLDRCKRCQIDLTEYKRKMNIGQTRPVVRPPTAPPPPPPPVVPPVVERRVEPPPPTPTPPPPLPKRPAPPKKDKPGLFSSLLKKPLGGPLGPPPEPSAPKVTAPEPAIPEPAAPEPAAPEPAVPEPIAREPRAARVPDTLESPAAGKRLVDQWLDTMGHRKAADFEPPRRATTEARPWETPPPPVPEPIAPPPDVQAPRPTTTWTTEILEELRADAVALDLVPPEPIAPKPPEPETPAPVRVESAPVEPEPIEPILSIDVPLDFDSVAPEPAAPEPVVPELPEPEPAEPEPPPIEIDRPEPIPFDARIAAEAGERIAPEFAIEPAAEPPGEVAFEAVVEREPEPVVEIVAVEPRRIDAEAAPLAEPTLILEFEPLVPEPVVPELAEAEPIAPEPISPEPIAPELAAPEPIAPELSIPAWSAVEEVEVAPVPDAVGDVVPEPEEGSARIEPEDEPRFALDLDTPPEEPAAIDIEAAAPAPIAPPMIELAPAEEFESDAAALERVTPEPTVDEPRFVIEMPTVPPEVLRALEPEPPPVATIPSAEPPAAAEAEDDGVQYVEELVEKASFAARTAALGIDMVLLTAVLAVCLAVGGLLIGFHPTGAGGARLLAAARVLALPSYLLMLVLTAGYFVLFHGSSGQTIGKMIVGARVVDTRGDGLGYSRAFLRYVGWLFSGTFFFLGFVWAAFDFNRQAWHDKLAHSCVIRAREEAS